MECNREEAVRAREVAEMRFTTRNIVGAKQFALKAQNLFPSLEGINQLIATLDVYLAAEIKINGESDLYSILSVDASADDETVKKQYRKLALLLHPDKNKSVGAEGAFKIVSEAWSVLSDKNRKMIYDQNRNVKRTYQTRNKHSVPSTNNGFYTFANNATSSKKSHKAQSPSFPIPKSNTFWTSCNRCKMQYEYLRVYLNHNLLCPNCHEAFLAVETGFPANGSSSKFTWSAPQQQRQKKSNHRKNVNLDSYDDSNFHWGPFSRTAGAASANASPSVAAQAASVVHQTYEKVKRQRQEAQAAARREEALRRKNSTSKRSQSSSGYYNAAERYAKRRRSTIDETATQQVVSESGKTQNAEASGLERASSGLGNASRISRLSGVLPQIDKRTLLFAKAKGELSKKLEEWNAAAAMRLKGKTKAKQKPKQKFNVNVKIPLKIDVSGGNEPSDPEQVTKPVSIVVPDPEFHDFDKGRLEKSFEGDQIWATYDSEDGMPRLYALIQKVISLRPFKLRMSFLNSKSNSELGPMNWVGSGFAKTCGDFRVGRYVVNETVNIFSHRVQYEKGVRGVIRIIPRVGETWAVYRNWASDWNELTPDDVIYKYDMVEVVDDYNEEQGVLVTPLVKVAGFRAVFHRHLDPNEVKRIPREEMFRFSHQVPSYLLTGEEAQNAPKGCQELDPAAIPADLLQVITEFKDDEVMETAQKHPVS